MSMNNPLWGAPRIHGELLKLGFDVAQSSVAKYMVRRRGPPGQGWLTFLRNHAPDIAAMDFFAVPTIGFDLLYAFVVIRMKRRDLVWITADRRYAASAWIISPFSARPIYAESCDATRAITTTSERIDHWIKMRRSLVQFSGPGASNRSPS
jgi:hypothetical protein